MKKTNVDNFYDAWWYLNEHAYFSDKSILMDDGKPWSSMFSRSLDIDVVKVNPKTLRIEDNVSLNTQVAVWLECGPQWKDETGQLWNNSHDTNLDCGADTFEEAIVELANLVEKLYPIEQWGKV